MPRISPPLMLISPDRPLAERARRLLARDALECAVLVDSGDCTRAPLCHWLKDPPQGQAGQLRALLVETVSVLDDTRHAFRSRELGRLRKRLELALRELPALED
ncbi:hypothetical protein ACUTAH_12135 [Metapseudomonas furukawaii]|uniref:hypothetical protein n=1 Tax=Metapseudomonas furukawaii TaxID=1149133 RepID=UPI0040454C2C